MWQVLKVILCEWNYLSVDIHNTQVQVCKQLVNRKPSYQIQVNLQNKNISK